MSSYELQVNCKDGGSAQEPDGSWRHWNSSNRIAIRVTVGSKAEAEAELKSMCDALIAGLVALHEINSPSHDDLAQELVINLSVFQPKVEDDKVVAVRSPSSLIEDDDDDDDDTPEGEQPES